MNRVFCLDIIFDSVYLGKLYLFPAKTKLLPEVVITDASSSSKEGGDQDRELLSDSFTAMWTSQKHFLD